MLHYLLYSFDSRIQCLFTDLEGESLDHYITYLKHQTTTGHLVCSGQYWFEMVNSGQFWSVSM